MVKQPTDVVPGQLGQAAVAALAVEQRLVALPEALVDVHARAVVLEQRLGHKRHGFAAGQGNIADDVLVQHQVVGGPQERAVPDVDFRLPRGPHLVVLHLDGDAGPEQRPCHLRAQIGEVVGRGYGEVTALEPGLVAEVPAVLLTGRVPGCFDGVDSVHGTVRAVVIANVVEDVELGLRAEVGGVRETRAPQVGFGFFRRVAWIAGVLLLCDRVVDEEGHRERLVLTERIDEGCARVR